MIKCTTTIGEKERDLINDIYLKKLEITSNRRRRVFRTVLSFCFAAGFLFFGLYGLLTEGMTQQVSMALFGGVLFLVWGFSADKVYKARLKRAYDKAVIESLSRMGMSYDHDEKIEYSFSEDDVHVKTEFSESHHNWNFFSSYEDTKRFIFLQKKDNNILIIDKNVMTDEELEELYALFHVANIVNESK